MIIPPLPPPTSLSLIDYQSTPNPQSVVTQVVFQRKPTTIASGSPTADIPILFGWTGGQPQPPQARLVRRVGGAAVTSWAALSGTTFGGSTGQGLLLNAPQGGDYLIQIRDAVTQPSSGALYSAGTQPIGVGVKVGFTGQSNMNNTQIAPDSGATPFAVPGYANEAAAWAAGTYQGSLFDHAGWHQPSNDGAGGPSGTGGGGGNSLVDNLFMTMRLIAAALKAQYGYDVPVGVTSMARNATAIVDFTGPSGPVWLDWLFSSGHTAIASGGTKDFGFATLPPYNSDAWYEVLCFHQGEQDSYGTTSQATYESALDTFYTQHLNYLAAYGFTSSTFKFLPMIIGTLAVSVGASVENVRSAQQHWVGVQQGAGKAGVALGGTTIDLTRVPVGGPPADDYHFTQPAVQRRSMARLLQACMKALGAAPYGARGPILGTPSRASNVITWPVVHEAGTGLQGATGSTGITGFAVNTAADFSGTAITVTAAIVGGNVVLTLPSSGVGYPVYVKYMGGQVGTAGSSTPDISNPVYDNTVYPRRTGQTGTDADSEALGFPLLPTVGAVTVS